MRSRCLTGIATIAAIAMVDAGVNSAQAESTPAADFTLGFSSQQPGSSTAMALRILFKDPSDPNAKPSPQRKIVIELPAGARIDGSAVPACTASDAELMAQGPAACPAGSQVGAGTLTLTTGGGPAFDPFVDDVKLFNGGSELVEVFNKQGNDTTTATGRRSYSNDNTLTETPAPQPGGPPNGESSVRLLDYHLDSLDGGNGGAFIRTPPTCPVSGAWTSRLTFTTADGVTQSALDTTPCRDDAAGAPPSPRPVPRIGVAVNPHRVRAGTRRRLRVRLRSSSKRCIRHALVRIAGGGRARSNARGRVTIVARFGSPGLHVLVAKHRRCRPGRTRIRVLPRPQSRRASSG